MKAGDIKALCENQRASIYETDSTLVFQAKFFGVSARTKVQFSRISHKPIMVDIGFEESTEAIRDTLISRFTMTMGRKPLVTTKEKSVIVFTFKMELNSWKTDKETISVTTMARGSSLLSLSILIAPLSSDQKKTAGENKGILD